MKILVYNTLSKKKEEFKTRTEKVVNMYVCGPTVYDYLHVGNFRGAIFFDSFRKFLEHQGYTVNYAYNYTDVDDKIIQRAKDEGKKELEISSKFIQEFEKDYNALKLKPHTYNPKVSDYIPQMIQYVQNIIDNNLAYEKKGSVYLRRHKLGELGELSGRSIEDGKKGDKNLLEEKEHPADFVLWKKSKEGEISWSSPWGEGRPGWHLECSVMIHEIFQGETLDIHGGGLDLMFPHHENECSQCKAHGQDKLANYWMHNNMLNFGGAKMSKSLGNVQTGRDFIENKSGELLKFVINSHHYRSVIDFSPEAIDNQRNSLARIYSALKKAKGKGKENNSFDDLRGKVLEALADDFNTPLVISYVHEAISRFYKKQKNGANLLSFVNFVGNFLNVFQEVPEEYLAYLDKQDLENIDISEKEINEKILLRKKFRDQKEYKKSDEIREILVKKKINLLDNIDGTTWEIIREDTQ